MSIDIDIDREEDKKKGGDSGEWMPADPYQRIYAQVTGQMTIPSGEIDKALPLLEAVYQNKGRNIQQSIEYLRPFFMEWKSRKGKNGRPYNVLNTAWLDWAIGGEIPKAGSDAEKQESYAKRQLREIEEREAASGNR